MKKKILVALFVLSFAAGCGKIPTMKDGDQAVVSFDDTNLSISVTDLYNKIKANYALTSLIDMVDTRILTSIYTDEVENAEDYADEQIETVKSYYVDEDGKYDENSLISALNSYYGISTIDEFRTMLILSHYRTKAVEDYSKKQVTDKEINNYYENDIYGDISASHILITSKATDDMTDEEKTKADEEALKKAKDVIKRLDDGEKFEDLAKELSEDEASATNGGDLGYFNDGDMVDEFWDAAKVLKLNAYTKSPVKSKYGYHIIIKTGEKDKKSLDDVKEEIIKTLAAEKVSSDQTLQINALVELRKEYGMEIQDSDLKKQYETYISNQLLSITTNNTNS